MIIHNATIHSPVERFATAMHIENGIIVWLGDEDTAGYRAKAHPQAETVDADRALITPSFHNTWAQEIASLHAHGITAAHIPATGPQPVAPVEHLDLVGRHDQAPALGPAVHVLAAETDRAEINEFLAQQRATGVTAALTIADEADADTLRGLGPVPPGSLLHVHASAGIDPELLHGWNVIVVFDGGEVALPLAAMAGAGVPYALGGELDPWQIINRALHDGPAPISARAAFNAMTRGAWRLTPGVFDPRGVIRVGAPADLALWQVDVLAVQAPDEKTAFWSTDERAGTPLLPALGEDEAPPRLAGVMHRGIRVGGGA